MAGGVTRADVAAAAGTSTAVVSYVVNNGPRPVAPATRERVLEAAARLGYRPNALAAGLSARRTKLVGLVVPDLTLPFFAEITASLAREASRRGLTLLAATSGWDPQREIEAVEQFVGLQVRGLALAPARKTLSSEHVLADAGTATVLISGEPGELLLPQVRSDDETAGRLATRHLLEHGFTDVVAMTVPLGGAPVGPRLHGWGVELAARAPHSQRTVLTCGFDRYSAERVAAELLTNTDEPVAIMATTDELALGVLAAATRLGRAVPEQCAVVGCDGIPEGLLTSPRLTTVTRPVDQLCVEVLDRLLDQDPDPVDPPVLPVALRLGGTCGAH